MSAVKQPKQGPVKVVKGKGRANGVEIPIYLSPTPSGTDNFIVVHYDERGIRQRKRCKTLPKAVDYAEGLIEAIAAKRPASVNFSTEQLIRINDAIEIFQRLDGLDILDAAVQYRHAHKLLGDTDIVSAARHYAEFREQQDASNSCPDIAIPVLVEEFIAHLKLEEKSDRDIYDVQSRLRRFAKAFQCSIQSITTQDLDRYLKEGDFQKKTRRNNRTSIVRLFSYARSKSYLPRNVDTNAHYTTTFKAKKRERKAVEIYSVPQMKLLLSKIDRSVLPFVTLAAFAGLRSAEIARLDWGNVQFERDGGVIDLTSELTKTGTRRLVDIQPVLRAWLKPIAKETGNVMGVRDEYHLSKRFRIAVQNLHEAKEPFIFSPLHNGFRHSFISYFYALTSDVKETAKQAGNSPEIIFESYNEPVTKEQGVNWFSLTPDVCNRNLEAETKLET